MAYVGTPSYQGSDRYTLASILQGEASSAAGQQAVASVIANRASQNYSGYGSSLLDQATARMQFQGQAAPTNQSLAIADQALAGTLPSNVGNATAYAAPGSTAGWATRALSSGQGITIGGNTFFASTAGGTPTGLGLGNGGVNEDSYVPGGMGFGGQGATLPGSTDNSVGFGLNGAQLSSDPGTNYALPGQASGNDGGLSNMKGYDSNIVGFGSGGPVQSNPQIVKATQQIGDNITKGSQTLAQAATSISNAWQLDAQDWFVRLAFIVAGLVVFGAGLYYFGRPIIDPVVKKVGKVAALAV